MGVLRLVCLAVVMGAVGLAWSAENTIVGVRVRVLDDFGTEPEDVLTYCDVEPGMELSQEAVSRDVRALVDTGRYGYAGVELEKVADGYNVIYVVKRRHRFQGPIAIKGADYLSESKLRKLVDLKNGDFVDEPILATRVAKVRDEYMKKYFPDIMIGAELNPIEGSAGFAEVVLTIEEGQRQKIRKYRFVGNHSISAKELRASFEKYEWYVPRGWFTDAPTTEQALADACKAVEALYFDLGYLDARVAMPVAERVDESRVDMVFEVTEGDQYTLESTAIRGVKLFPEAEVLARSPLEVDQVVGQSGLDAAARRIREYYGERGYVDTAVRPVREAIPGQPGRVAITFDVMEGELAYIRNIVIRGNNKTKDKVIRREVLVSPGEIVNEVAVTRSENRLKNLGYFESVRSYTEDVGEEGKRDLVYEVEEQRTGNIMIGAGFSSIDNLVGFLELTQNNFDILNWPNFTGGGQKARLGVEVGTRRQTYEVSWTEPWLMDRPIALHVDLYRRLRWNDQYDDVRTGGSVGLSYPIKVGRFGVRYTLEMVEMEDVNKSEWYLDKEGMVDSTPDDSDFDNQYFKYQKSEFSENLNSIVRLYWAHDTRDQPFVPTKGYRALLYGEGSEGGVGDNEFYRMGVSLRHWFPMPWGKHVFSLSGRAETVDAYKGELPVYEKLFLGGPRSIRGVKYRDVGPKLYRGEDSKRHVPMGGQTLLQGTAEYTIPIFKALRFATFIDAGSLGSDEFDPETSNFSVAAGIGFRIDIPGFPIRFDFAKPIHDDDSYTKDEFFSFAIGFD